MAAKVLFYLRGHFRIEGDKRCKIMLALFCVFDTNVASQKNDNNVTKTKKKQGIIYDHSDTRRVAAPLSRAQKELASYKGIRTKIKQNEERLTRLFNNLPGMAYSCSVDKEYRPTLEFVSRGCIDLLVCCPNILPNSIPMSWKQWPFQRTCLPYAKNRMPQLTGIVLTK